MTESGQLTYPYTYPWFVTNLFIVLYVVSHIVKSTLHRLSPVYRQLDHEKQHNAVTYVIEVVVTIFALCLQCYGGRHVLFSDFDAYYVDPRRMEWSTFSLQTITVLYVWELIYRLKIGWPLLMHHICTLLMVQLVALAFSETHSLVFLRFALMMGLHATMEQSSFVALFAYRLHLFKNHQRTLFRIAAWQSFLAKTGIFVGTTVYYIKVVNRFETIGWYKFWKICYVPLHLTLYLAQLYACKILFILAEKTRTGKAGDGQDMNGSNPSTTDELSTVNGGSSDKEDQAKSEIQDGASNGYNNIRTTSSLLHHSESIAERMERAIRCFPVELDDMVKMFGDDRSAKTAKVKNLDDRSSTTEGDLSC